MGTIVCSVARRSRYHGFYLSAHPPVSTAVFPPLLAETRIEQAMHSVICIARRKEPLKASPARQTNHNAPTRESYDAVAGVTSGLAPDDAENTRARGLAEDVAEALLRRGKNLEQLVSVLTRAMDLHQAVAPLQWICVVCLIDLHALEARVSEMFMIRSGCQILHRCVCVRGRTAIAFPTFLRVCDPALLFDPPSS